MIKKNYFIAIAVVALCLTKYSVAHAQLGSAVEGNGATISLFDSKTRSRVGEFKLFGELWFLNGGKTTEVGDGTRVEDFSFGSYNHPGKNNLQIRAVGDHFVLSSKARRYKISFPSMGFSAFVKEIKTNNKVLSAQKKLKELGYEPGVPDGIWGQKTKTALQRFQQDSNLPATGKLDPETERKLGAK